METEIDGEEKKRRKEKAVSTLMVMSPMRRMRRVHEINSWILV